MAEANHQGPDHGERHPENHFLVVAHGMQGHLNPARLLARRLARAAGVGATLATLSIPVSGHRRMFPSLAAPDDEVFDGVVSYVPFSDGFDEGSSMFRDAEERERSRLASYESLSAVVARLAASGRPVTCIVSTMGIASLPRVAREHGIPMAVYWIQPAIALGAYYHYFHGYDDLVAPHASDQAYELTMPGPLPLRVRDWPSFLVDTTNSEFSQVIVQLLRELFQHLDAGEKPMFLVNSSDALEAAVFRAMQLHLELFAVGPMVPREERSDSRIHLIKQDEKAYMTWLSARPERSVVYVSFGSVLSYDKRQVEEMARGLRQCARPYLWEVRKDGREEEVERCLADSHAGRQEEGMVVEWCEQLEVLSHPAVGCFVTHCGWNSTLEAVACGVPMVAAPNWSDQPTAAHLVEEAWGVGARAGRDAEGVLAEAELVRCVESVMGDGEGAAEIREKAKVLKEMAREAMAGGGPAEGSLRDFVKAVQARKVARDQEKSQPTKPHASE